MSNEESKTMESEERNYRNVLDDALKDVKQELVILIDGAYYLTYIHGIDYDSNGRIILDWSTPHDETEIERAVLLKHVESAINAQIKEGIECQSKNLSSRIYSFMKNIFGKFTHS